MKGKNWQNLGYAWLNLTWQKKLSLWLVSLVVMFYYPLNNYWQLKQEQDFLSLQGQIAQTDLAKQQAKLKILQKKLPAKISRSDLAKQLEPLEEFILSHQSSYFKILNLDWVLSNKPILVLKIQSSFFYFYGFLQSLFKQNSYLEIQQLQIEKISKEDSTKNKHNLLLIEITLQHNSTLMRK